MTKINQNAGSNSPRRTPGKNPMSPEEKVEKILKDELSKNPRIPIIQKSFKRFIETEGQLRKEELQQLAMQMESVLKGIDPSLDMPSSFMTHTNMLNLAVRTGILSADTLLTLGKSLKEESESSESEKKPQENESLVSLDEQYQRVKTQWRRTRSLGEKQALMLRMQEIRQKFEKTYGESYSLYLHRKKAERDKHRQDVTEVSYDEHGNKTVYNTETGSSVTFHKRSTAESTVSDDDFREAKRAIDRGPMGGGRRQLPRDRIASDGRVNFFTEGDRQEVQDFINARASRRLARLEQMESFAAQRADIMDVLTNPDRFEREFQKIKEAPIDYSAPGVMERARKNNVVHFLLSEDHTMVHDVANEPPTRAEIEALRRDAIFRDSWNKVDRRSENMMNFDQFITFRQTGWEDRDTEKFIPSMTKDGFVKDYAYIFHKNSRQELVINPKGEIVAHRWQKPLSDGKIMIAETRFGRPKGSPLKVSRVDFQKTWKNGVPGKLALRDHDGKSLPENFTIDLSKFPRDGRGMMIGNVAWIERDGNSAFKILFMKEGNYDLHALEATSKQRKHALVAVTKGSEKQQTA